MHEPMDEWTFESRIYSEFVCCYCWRLLPQTLTSVQCTVTQSWKP
jgi:hypothetical protein